MSERCKHVEKNGFNCGSYAFNLYKDGIDQGNLCDVHYWQAKALAQPEQEPVAWEQFYPDIGKPQLTYPPQGIYYTPPQRTWVGLTDEEYIHITDSVYHQGHGLVAYYKAIEATLKDKNNAA